MEINKRFTDKHVLITGGARGIGLEIARQFAAEGAVLSLLDYNEVNLVSAIKSLADNGALVYSYPIDISNKQQVTDTIAKADAIKPIDVLINNAGIAAETPFLNIEEEEWNNIININLTGMFFVAQSVCRLMAKRGKGVVVNMSSKNGLDGELKHLHVQLYSNRKLLNLEAHPQDDHQVDLLHQHKEFHDLLLLVNQVQKLSPLQ